MTLGNGSCVRVAVQLFLPKLDMARPHAAVEEGILTIDELVVRDLFQLSSVRSDRDGSRLMGKLAKLRLELHYAPPFAFRWKGLPQHVTRPLSSTFSR